MSFVAPAGWPVDCPPEAANPTDGDFFHLACTKPLSSGGGSFRSAFENNVFRGRCPCQRRSISVFPSEVDVLDFLNLLTDAKKKRWTVIARADLKPEHGVVLETPSLSDRHMTWWTLLESEARIALFSIVREL